MLFRSIQKHLECSKFVLVIVPYKLWIAPLKSDNKAMKTITDYPIGELKLIYNLLHANVQLHFELMDSELLADLQKHLQKIAASENIDVTHHAQWKAWLDNQSPFPLDEAPGDIGA